ncbi:hypothetical protein ACFW6S_23120 [Streptomyces sp. NPDC058740]|uniref:hypothetical protein n=1 Tax=Streptomyces sp. NPDC058740 TaxID=3346619 RepID=UPI00368BE8B2
MGETVHNEISGGRITTAIQAQVIHAVHLHGGGAQATPPGVFAWTGPDERCRVWRRARGKPAWVYHFHEIVAFNGTVQPVSDVVVCVPAPDADLLPGEDPLAMIAVGLIPPGGYRRIGIGHLGQFEPQYPVSLEVHYTDPQGVGWRRDGDGRVEVTP